MAKRRASRVAARKKAGRGTSTRVSATRTRSRAAGTARKTASKGRPKKKGTRPIRATAKKAPTKRAARKKAVKKAAPSRKKAVRKTPTRKGPARKSSARKSPLRKTATRRTAVGTGTARKASARKAVRKKATTPKSLGPRAQAVAPRRRPVARSPVRKVPALYRTRRIASDEDLLPAPDAPAIVDRTPPSTGKGHRELLKRLYDHPEASPALTGGDVDADWAGAYATGDEAPGGDNPTPDQDIVEEIGRALGVQYDDDEELRGADKISDRDKHRWDPDPASTEGDDDT